VADIYSEKILDPWNDQYIPAANYPSLKAYPTGQSNIVSVLQTNKPAYTWNVTNFNRPDKRNLLIYELLVRDFVATQNWQTLKDTLTYLKRLGINAIELMPINEFEGNNSWGYNPDFFFAPDKQYGTETALKQFIDVCHANGIAVIMDIAMNHAFGLSPTVRMYWDAVNNKPAINNPWHNPDATHPYSVGYDFNHESDATKYLVSRVIRHWLTNYKIDGFRWDLSKGFTQTNSGNDVNLWGNYDASRVAIWKRIFDSMQLVSPNSYCILEHFAANSEEIELANYGMLLWGNLNYNFNEATKGNLPASNFQWGIYTNRNWTVPNLVTYQESHDEERLMYRNETEGVTTGSMNVRLLNNGLKRNEMAAAFWAMIPGPKMMWQFGELGYDYSINTCSDGFTISNGCRLDPKPIRWDYKSNANRQSLYNVYSKLFALRKYAPYLPTFTTNDIEYALGGAFKYLKVTSPSLKICVVGNFDVNTTSGYVTFQNAGTWYDFINGGTITTAGGLEYLTLQPGEYHVYLDRDASAVLPLTLLSFNGKRNAEAILLNWTTTNENNVSHFEVERSFNGSDFSIVNTVSAKNISGINNYTDKDFDSRALTSTAKIYYRLKMVDKDGRYSYSKMVEIGTSKNSSVIIYPNPVKGENISIKLATSEWKQVSIVLTNVNGKACKTWNISPATTSEIKLNIGGLSNGVYFLKLTGEKKVEVYSLIIDHK
jgi:glycosidase